jgi:hypothetical protein
MCVYLQNLSEVSCTTIVPYIPLLPKQTCLRAPAQNVNISLPSLDTGMAKPQNTAWPVAVEQPRE